MDMKEAQKMNKNDDLNFTPPPPAGPVKKGLIGGFMCF